jgi:hypothetical protein
MTEKMRPSRRAVVQAAATAAALATLGYLGVEPAVADTTPPQQAQQPAPKRRVPVGLL